MEGGSAGSVFPSLAASSIASLGQHEGSRSTVEQKLHSWKNEVSVFLDQLQYGSSSMSAATIEDPVFEGMMRDFLTYQKTLHVMYEAIEKFMSSVETLCEGVAGISEAAFLHLTKKTEELIARDACRFRESSHKITRVDAPHSAIAKLRRDIDFNVIVPLRKHLQFNQQLKRELQARKIRRGEMFLAQRKFEHVCAMRMPSASADHDHEGANYSSSEVFNQKRPFTSDKEYLAAEAALETAKMRFQEVDVPLFEWMMMLDAYKGDIYDSLLQTIKYLQYEFFASSAHAVSHVLPVRMEFRPMIEMTPDQLEPQVEMELAEAITQQDALSEGLGARDPSMYGSILAERQNRGDCSGSGVITSDPSPIVSSAAAIKGINNATLKILDKWEREISSAPSIPSNPSVVCTDIHGSGGSECVSSAVGDGLEDELGDEHSSRAAAQDANFAVDPLSLSVLMAQGFEEGKARRALRIHKNDTQAALDALLHRELNTRREVSSGGERTAPLSPSSTDAQKSSKSENLSNTLLKPSDASVRLPTTLKWVRKLKAARKKEREEREKRRRDQREWEEELDRREAIRRRESNIQSKSGSKSKSHKLDPSSSESGRQNKKSLKGSHTSGGGSVNQQSFTESGRRRKFNDSSGTALPSDTAELSTDHRDPNRSNEDLLSGDQGDTVSRSSRVSHHISKNSKTSPNFSPSSTPSSSRSSSSSIVSSDEDRKRNENGKPRRNDSFSLLDDDDLSAQTKGERGVAGPLVQPLFDEKHPEEAEGAESMADKEGPTKRMHRHKDTKKRDRIKTRRRARKRSVRKSQDDTDDDERSDTEEERDKRLTAEANRLTQESLRREKERDRSGWSSTSWVAESGSRRTAASGVSGKVMVQEGGATSANGSDECSEVPADDAGDGDEGEEGVLLPLSSSSIAGIDGGKADSKDVQGFETNTSDKGVAKEDRSGTLSDLGGVHADSRIQKKRQHRDGRQKRKDGEGQEGQRHDGSSDEGISGRSQATDCKSKERRSRGSKGMRGVSHTKGDGKYDADEVSSDSSSTLSPSSAPRMSANKRRSALASRLHRSMRDTASAKDEEGDGAEDGTPKSESTSPESRLTVKRHERQSHRRQHHRQQRVSRRHRHSREMRSGEVRSSRDPDGKSEGSGTSEKSDSGSGGEASNSSDYASGRGRKSNKTSKCSGSRFISSSTSLIDLAAEAPPPAPTEFSPATFSAQRLPDLLESFDPNRCSWARGNFPPSLSRMREIGTDDDIASVGDGGDNHGYADLLTLNEGGLVGEMQSKRSSVGTKRDDQRSISDSSSWDDGLI